MKKLLVIGLLLTFGLGPSLAFAQTSLRPERPEEQILVGQVQSVDDSGTELTLTDGTKLLTPPGKMLRPGALEEGMVVVAVYREQENGDKILTQLELGEPAARSGDSPRPSDSPKRF